MTKGGCLVSLGEVRFGRIAALRRQIQAGSYRVSTLRLAEALLGRMLASGTDPPHGRLSSGPDRQPAGYPN